MAGMRNRVARIVTQGLAAALAVPAAAQEAPPPQDAPIVVTGTRTTDEEIADFVDAFTVAPIGGQLSRFEWAVCPVASGVAPALKPVVADRIRAVARAAGVRVAKAKCLPNVLVIVTPDKKALLTALQRSRPEYFEGFSGAERRALRESDAPAAAWHIEGPPLTADGMEMPSNDGVYVNNTTSQGSRISFATRPQFAAAIVVVESKALTGLTTIQLADYAAMRTLISTDPALLDKSSIPTILKVLDAPMGSAVPRTLTQWDLGIVRALYAGNPTLTARSQGSAMRRRLKGDIERRRK